MSLETEPHRLAGIADPLGKKIGFLIPVFARAQSNALRVERVDKSGTVIAFVDLEPQETNFYEIPLNLRRESGVGAWPHWAFGFGTEFIIGQGLNERDQLLKRLKGEFFSERPFLAFEVSEFLDLGKERLQIAETIVKRLQRITPETAEIWRDLSVLTPDIRKSLSTFVVGRSDGHAPGLQRITARVHEGVIQIRGLTLDQYSAHAVQIENQVKRTLDELGSLYRKPRDGWAIELVRPTASSERATLKGYDLSKLSALVCIFDDDSAVLNRVFSRPSIDRGIGLYPPRQFRTFAYQSSEFLRPSFILFRLDNRLGPVWPKDDVFRSRWPIGIAVRTSTASKLTSAERDGLERYQHPTIVVPVREGGAWQPNAGMAGETKDAVRLLAAWDAELSRRLPRTSYFLRATGSGPDRSDDALTQIFGRCWRLGLTALQGTLFQFESDARRFARPLASLLFPDLQIEGVTNGYRPKFNAAILASEAHIETGGDGAIYERVVQGVLENQGWSISGGAGRRTYELSDSDMRVGGKFSWLDISIRNGRIRPRKPGNFGDLVDQDLGDTKQIIVTEEAGASAVVGCLAERHSLLASIRDLIVFPAQESSIWTLFASQMRRFVSSLPARSRSNYFAMLVQASIQYDKVQLPKADEIMRALHHPSFGKRLHLLCSSIRYEPDHAVAKLRLHQGPGPQLMREYRADLHFELSVSFDGPTLLPPQES